MLLGDFSGGCFPKQLSEGTDAGKYYILIIKVLKVAQTRKVVYSDWRVTKQIIQEPSYTNSFLIIFCNNLIL